MEDPEEGVGGGRVPGGGVDLLNQNARFPANIVTRVENSNFLFRSLYSISHAASSVECGDEGARGEKLLGIRIRRWLHRIFSSPAARRKGGGKERFLTLVFFFAEEGGRVALP